MIKLFLQHTIGTKAFLYGGASLILAVWFIYFHIINFQFWMNSDMHVLISVIALLVGEGIILYAHEIFKDKRKPTIREKTITKLPIYEELKDRNRKSNLGDYMHDWADEEERNAELEYFEKQEAKHEK